MPPPPKILSLNVIESCDARCRYCHWWRVESEPEPMARLIEAVDDAAALGTTAIRISGGEPLLRDDLPELVAHIASRGLVGMVCTAAKDDIEGLLALVDAGLDILSVSVDTLDAERFRKLRGYDLAPVMRNLEELASRRDASGFEVVLSVVVSRLSAADLPTLLEFARSLDLIVSLTPFQDGTPERRSPMSVLAFGPDDEAALRGSLAFAERAARAGLRLLNADEFLGGFPGFLLSRRLPEGHVCRAGDEAAIRLAGGAIKLCHSLDGVGAGSLSEAWGSPAANDLRARMARLDCPGCWLSCHADPRRPAAPRYGRAALWEAL